MTLGNSKLQAPFPPFPGPLLPLLTLVQFHGGLATIDNQAACPITQKPWLAISRIDKLASRNNNVQSLAAPILPSSYHIGAHKT